MTEQPHIFPRERYHRCPAYLGDWRVDGYCSMPHSWYPQGDGAIRPTESEYRRLVADTIAARTTLGLCAKEMRP